MTFSTDYYKGGATFVCCLVFLTVFISVRDLRSVHGIDKMLGIFWLMPFLSSITIAFFYFNRQPRFKISFLDVCFFFSFLFLVTNYYTSDSLAKSKLLIVINLFVIYYHLRILVLFIPYLRKVITTLLISILFVEAICGLLQLFNCFPSLHGLFKITGTFLNPGPYAGFLVILSMLPIYQLLISNTKFSNIQKSNWQRLLCWGAISSVIAILPSTHARIAWVACMVSLLLMLLCETSLLLKVKQYTRNRKILMGMKLLGIVFIFLGCFWFFYKIKPDSANGRMLIWKLTGHVIKENPITGVGFGNFKGAYANKQSIYFMNSDATVNEKYVAGMPDYPFNEYMLIFSEFGLIGLIIFCIMIYVILKGLFNQKRRDFFYLAVAFLILCFGSYPLHVLPYGLIVILLAAVSQSSNKGSFMIPSWILIGFSVLMLSFTVFALRYGLRLNTAFQQWDLIQPSYQHGGYKSVVHIYDNLSPMLIGEGRFALEYADCLAKSQQILESNDVLIQCQGILNDPHYFILLGQNHQLLGQLDKAEVYFKKAAYHSPNRIYPLYLLADFYCQTQRISEGVELANQALLIEPKIISKEVEKIQGQLKALISKY